MTLGFGGNMSEQFYIELRGKIQGPFPREQIEKYEREGRIKARMRLSTDKATWYAPAEFGFATTGSGSDDRRPAERGESPTPTPEPGAQERGPRRGRQPKSGRSTARDPSSRRSRSRGRRGSGGSTNEEGSTRTNKLLISGSAVGAVVVVILAIVFVGGESAPVPEPGLWKGDHGLAFTVEDSLVKGLTISARVPFRGGVANTTAHHPDEMTVSGGQFKGEHSGLVIEGRFIDSVRAEGTARVTTSVPTDVPGVLKKKSVTLEWKASRGSTPTPDSGDSADGSTSAGSSTSERSRPDRPSLLPSSFCFAQPEKADVMGDERAATAGSKFVSVQTESAKEIDSIIDAAKKAGGKLAIVLVTRNGKEHGSLLLRRQMKYSADGTGRVGLFGWLFEIPASESGFWLRVKSDPPRNYALQPLPSGGGSDKAKESVSGDGSDKESVEAPAPEPKFEDGGQIPGFTFVGMETFECPNDVEGKKQFTLAVYRCDAFWKAIGRPSGRQVDTEFVLLPPKGHSGRFQMGSPASEKGRYDRYEAQEAVRIRKRFLIARTEVSQRVYDALRGEHDNYDWPGAKQPANQVSWNDTSAWCARLGLRLPSGSEWEFACRGGTSTPFCFGSTVTPSKVNYVGDAPYGTAAKGLNRKKTVEVGSLPDNAYGLFEVHGNLYEWCQGGYAASRVYRGGSWSHGAVLCRSAHVNRDTPRWRSNHHGFRPSKTAGR